MKLIVGLGNPGKKYKFNRHNIGFLVLDKLINSYELHFKKKKNFEYISINNVIFVKPKTYMNRSGEAITSVMTNNSIDDILIIVDDINLPLGEIRLRREGGSGGHNGLKSIASSIGSSKYKRLRIGVGDPEQKDLSDFVLSNFPEHEKKVLNLMFDFTGKLLKEYIEFDFEKMMEVFSKLKKSYSEKITESQDR